MLIYKTKKNGVQVQPKLWEILFYSYVYFSVHRLATAITTQGFMQVWSSLVFLDNVVETNGALLLSIQHCEPSDLFCNFVPLRNLQK